MGCFLPRAAYRSPEKAESPMKTKVYFSDTCPTCTRAAGAPFRIYVDGKVAQGCVDHFHTGHLLFATQSASWHARPEAKKVRMASKAARHGCVTEAGV